MRRKILLALMLPLAAANCAEDAGRASKPAAAAMTEDAIGHYCRMTLTSHPGPKAQIHLAGRAEPLWFAQVRDSIAYRKSPEQSHRILAHYVNDIGAAPNWARPGADNWIAAESAYFVVNSDARGGMGAPELAPFAQAHAAETFARRRGGTVLRLGEIASSMALAPVESHSSH